MCLSKYEEKGQKCLSSLKKINQFIILLTLSKTWVLNSIYIIEATYNDKIFHEVFLYEILLKIIISETYLSPHIAIHNFQVQ